MPEFDKLDNISSDGKIEEPKEKQQKEFKVIDTKGREKTYTILDHDIKELYAQAIIDNTSFVCCYFPTRLEKKTKVKDAIITDIDWVNSAYFILSNGLQKKVFDH